MAGSLARHLVEGFGPLAPKGWRAHAEHPLFPRTFADRIGYAPDADLVLEAPSGERIVLELEISRADPVANQAKVLIAYAAGFLGPRDTFVSMLSPHLQRGRRNLAALFTRHLRAEGRNAFCVSLLPELQPAQVALLNQSASLPADLPVARELKRALTIAKPLADLGHRIHFAGDASDVIASLWTWNDELAAEPSLSWERRRVQYFVHDPVSRTFAPAKFCAFLPVQRTPDTPAPPTMTHAVYTTLGEQDPRFDGHIARKHVTERLAFVEVKPTGALAEAFAAWRARLGPRVSVRGAVRVLVPPAWFAGER
jgi:hypothetical protein